MPSPFPRRCRLPPPVSRSGVRRQLPFPARRRCWIWIESRRPWIKVFASLPSSGSGEEEIQCICTATAVPPPTVPRHVRWRRNQGHPSTPQAPHEFDSHSARRHVQVEEVVLACECKVGGDGTLLGHRHGPALSTWYLQYMAMLPDLAHLHDG